MTMKKFWVYGYGGELKIVWARTARKAAKVADFAIAVIRSSSGAALTPDLWA
jgi:hypothetical protein